MDFSLGEITRPHDDIDLYAMASDADRIAELLTGSGFEELIASAQNAQRNLVKDDEVFHVALLERTAAGALITPGGRWTASSGAPEEWPDEMLDDPPGRLGDLVVPVVSIAGQLHAKESAALVPGHVLTEKHRDDIDRLQRKAAARF